MNLFLRLLGILKCIYYKKKYVDFDEELRKFLLSDEYFMRKNKIDCKLSDFKWFDFCVKCLMKLKY